MSARAKPNEVEWSLGLQRLLGTSPEEGYEQLIRETLETFKEMDKPDPEPEPDPGNAIRTVKFPLDILERLVYNK